MALAEQTEFAFMKAAKGTDVPKPEVIELDEHIDAYKKKYGLTDEEVIEILRSFAPPKAKQNNEGGLQEQGGTKDPVSGNDVPIGSLKEEVRDDIPAMLSEGEFVFPADVTRYYGLDTLMKMRQKAKQGLKVMEAMGQMGNSEEATIPDDIPFDMDDLELAEGGVVEAQQGIYMSPEVNPPAITLQPGFGTAPQLGPTSPLPNVGGYTPPPIADPTPKSFSDLMGTAGYDELRPYVNEQGQQMQIPFKDGKPIRPIPEGFKPKGASADTTVRPTFTTATDTTGSGSSGVTMPSVEQQKVADDLLLGSDKDIEQNIKEGKYGETPAQTGVQPKSAEAFETSDFASYLKVKSPAGTEGVDYSNTGQPTYYLDSIPDVTGGNLIGKAGDLFDRGVGAVLPGALTRQSDRAIRREAADRLNKGQYGSATDFNILRSIVELEPPKAGKLSLFGREDDKELTNSINKAKGVKYKQGVANTHKKNKEKFDAAVRAEKEKRGAVYDEKGRKIRNETTNVEMTKMMITQNPSRDTAIMMGETPFERETRERNEAEAMKQAAQLDALQNREDERSADESSGTSFSEPTASESAGTHCCTASYKQKTMTISEVKELRRWHRQQSQVWQDGYDVWGKYVADGLVAKSKWQASVVKSVHDLLIKKKLTLKGLYGMIVISSGVYPIGLFKRITKYGRIFQST